VRRTLLLLLIALAAAVPPTADAQPCPLPAPVCPQPEPEPTPEPTPAPQPTPPPDPDRPRPPTEPPPNSGEAVAFQNDSGRSGTASEPNLFGPLEPRWTKVFRGYVNYPLLVAGKVIVNVTNDSAQGGGSTVVALDVITGGQLWRAETPGSGYSAHIAAGRDRVFSLNQNGVLRAFALANGAQLWESAPHAGRTPAFSYHLPVVAGGMVYVVTVETFPVVYALSAADGRLVWKAEAPPTGIGGVLADADRLYLTSDCHARALDRATGRVVWEHRGDPVHCRGSRPVLTEGRLHLGNEILDAANGAPVGQARFAGSTALGGGRAFQILQYEEGKLDAIDLLTGRPGWSWADRAGPASFSDPLGPLQAGGNVYMVTPSRHLWGFDVRDGVPTTTNRLPEHTESAIGGRQGGIAAGQGVLAVTQLRALTVMAPALRPPPGGMDIAATAFAVDVGRRAGFAFAPGAPLRAAGRVLTLEQDVHPYGRWRRAATRAAQTDGHGWTTLRIRRNTRLRARTAGARASRRITVYAYPKVRIRYRGIGGRRVEARVRLAGAPASGRTVVLYLGSRAKRRYARLGSAGLRRAKSAYTASIRFTAPAGVGRKDVIAWCVPGLAARGYGLNDGFQRGCGRMRMPYRP
jgi:outer membrane protein assembly factor BamB